MTENPQNDAKDRPFSPGETVVFPSHGIAQVEGTEERGGKKYLRLQVTKSHMVALVPLEKAHGLVRRPVSLEEAQRLLAILCDRAGEPDDRHSAYRFRDSERALVNGSFEEQVRALQRQYLSRYRLSFGELRMLDRFESAVLSELAHVLGVDRKSLITELHGSSTAFSGTAPSRPQEAPLQRPSPPSPIKLRGYEYLGEFQVIGGKLAIGEWTESSVDQPPEVEERTNVLVTALAGGWHAFLREGDEVDGLVAVHRDHVAELEALSEGAEEVGRVVVEGGTLSMLDSAVRDDPAFIDEQKFPLFPSGLIRDRGCRCSTGGDGVFSVLGTAKGDAMVFVAVSF